MNKTYFSNIEKHIIEKLENAQVNVYALLAWLTNSNIIESFRKALLNGCKVNIVLSNSEWNLISKDNINSLIALGAIFKTFGADESINLKAFLHHKICIIDEKYVLNGSFNYTNQANKNYESYNIKLDEVDAKNCLTHFQNFWEAAELLDWGKIENSASYTIKDLQTFESEGKNPEEIIVRKRIIEEVRVIETTLQTIYRPIPENEPIINGNYIANDNTEVYNKINEVTEKNKNYLPYSKLQVVESVNQSVNPQTGKLEPLIDKYGNPYYKVTFSPFFDDRNILVPSNMFCKRTIFSSDGFIPIKGKIIDGIIETFKVDGEYPIKLEDGTSRMVSKITVVALGENPNTVYVANSNLKKYNLTVITKEGFVKQRTTRKQPNIASDVELNNDD